MSKDPLGRLERVALRDYWTKEDAEFTPWLGRQENLALLGDAIGRDLEPQGEEVAVGSFRADILCRDAGTGELVLVENQIEATDHTHLGQILTYVAGLGAKTIVWVAREFREEHRAALDWLNEVTNDEIEFYGVQVELWRIGTSAPAPRFDVVAHPNEWTREVRHVARDVAEQTPAQRLKTAFWTSLAHHLEATGSPRRRPTPRPHNWWGWSIGRGDFEIVVSVNPRDSAVRAFLVLHGEPAKARFHALRRERQAIEADAGMALDWREMPDKTESQIGVGRECDFQRPESWGAVHTWLVDAVERLDRAFRARVRALRGEDGAPV